MTQTENPVVQTYASVIRRHNQYTLRALDGVSDAQAVVRASEGGSNILWLAGHIAWSYDALAVQGLAKKPSVLPENYPALFGMGSKAPSEADPSMEEVRDNLAKAAGAALDYMESLSDGVLGDDLPDDFSAKDFFGTYGGFLRAMSFHEAYHAGQIGLLRRVAGLSGTFGV